MIVQSLYRHPVKGLCSEPIDAAEFLPARGILGDRAFAFQFLDASVPKEFRDAEEVSAPWMPKFHLAVQHDWPALARVKPTLQGEILTLLDTLTGEVISSSVVSPDGRKKLAHFIHSFLQKAEPFSKSRHPEASEVRLIGDPNLSSRFTDSNGGPISLTTQETLNDMGEKLGFSIDVRRFRKNLVLSGFEPWAEQKWIGKRIRVGECVLEIQKPLGRCPNIDVHPETGVRDQEIFTRLKPTFGHAILGVRAEVVQPGRVQKGDTVFIG